MQAPVAATASGVIALTVAAVPTGMNAGVSMTPCAVVNRPRRAAPSRSRTSKPIPDFSKLCIWRDGRQSAFGLKSPRPAALRQQFAGVHQASGVERLLDAAHDLEFGAAPPLRHHVT